MLAIAPSARCQTLADYQFSTGNDASRWYTLDSTTNLLTQGTGRYYKWSTLQNIGFTFPFANGTYTQFSVTHDGNLRLGPVLALSSSGNQGSPFVASRAGSNNPKINFFGCSGYTSDTNYIHKQLFGTAPDRVLVVDFCLATYGGGANTRPSDLRYQVHLHENGDIEVVYPSRPPTRLTTVTRQQGMCVDETDIWFVDQNHTATHYTAGCSATVPVGFWPDTNRYYRFAFPQDVCLAPSGLIAAAVEDSSVTLQWNNIDNVSSFLVEYSTTPISSGGGGDTSMTIYDTTVVIDGLTPNTLYYFYVRSICGDTSNAAQVTARTLITGPVSNYPYFCDFESSDERAGWIVPGSLSTRWCMGTAVNNTTAGQYALYVSQDNGSTNTGGDDWIGTYVYRDVNLTAGDWVISFDWRAYGDFRANSAGVTNYYHFMRAFLVPSSVSFNAATPPSFPVPSGNAHGTAVPSGWIDLNPATHAFAGQNTWTTHQAVLTIPTSGCYHLVFYWETDGYDPETDMPGAVDNVSLVRQDCSQPIDLAATPSDDQILLTWRPGRNESNWMVRYGTVEDYVQDTFYMAIGLTGNTPYLFEVYAICGEGDTSLATTITSRTTDGGPVTVFPYLCTFEDSLAAYQWVTPGEGQINQWYVGTAVNNTPQGQKSLYVSQDGGVTNTYSGSSRSRSYAYRRLALDTIEYACSFDWRCEGDESFHFMRAFIVPETAIPAAGTFPATSNIHTTVPTGWIDLNPQTHYMSGQSTWTTLSQVFSVPDSGNYALLFLWDNDEYTPSNPPAAVDNVQVAPLTCHMPSGLSASSTRTTIDLTWDPSSEASVWVVEYDTISDFVITPGFTATGLTPNTEYQFRIRTVCQNVDTSLAVVITVRTACEPEVALPFICDFESYNVGDGSDENFLPCWNRVRNYSTFSPYISASTSPANKYLYWNLTAGMLDDVYVTLPEMDTTIEIAYTELRFKAMKVDFMDMFEDPVMIVGVMTDPNSIATFTPVDTVYVTNSSTFDNFSVPMLSYTGQGHYVAIRGTLNGSVNSSAMCQMDDVELHELPVCRLPQGLTADPGIDTMALDWIPGGNEDSWIVTYADTTVNTLTPSYVARGLQPDSLYTFSVFSVCSFGDTSIALTRSYRTQPLPLCQVPQAFNGRPGIDTIALSWAPGGDEEVWILTYADTMVMTAEPRYVARNLQPDREYRFSVVAVCPYGNVSDTLSEVFRTQPLPPECPPVTALNVSQNPDNENLVTVTWSGQADAYVVLFSRYPSGTVFFTDTVEGISYIFDFQDNADSWTVGVKALCSDGVESEWVESNHFSTPGHNGIGNPDNGIAVTIYPNPAYGPSTLYLSGVEGTATVSVIDLLGSLVSTHSVACHAGATATLALGDLPAGTYFVRINALGVSAVRKLVVR